MLFPKEYQKRSSLILNRNAHVNMLQIFLYTYRLLVFLVKVDDSIYLLTPINQLYCQNNLRLIQIKRAILQQLLHKIVLYLVQDFLNAIPSKFKLIDINLNEENSTEGLKPRKNYLLPIDEGYKDIYTGYKGQAKRNLKRLFSRPHWVYTGIAVVDAETKKQLVDYIKKEELQLAILKLK